MPEKLIKDEDNNETTCGIRLLNKHLLELSEDHLYHIALSTGKHDLRSMFGDVKFVCFGGPADRMRLFAKLMSKELSVEETSLKNYAENANRYVVYKTGPVLSVNHGIGIPSLSVVFQEIVKLLCYAGCEDVTYFRIGTCGGIGVDGGTVIISDRVVDGSLDPAYKTLVLGKPVIHPAVVDQSLVNQLQDCSEKINDFTTITGTTMCADDFYEGQGRTDGAFCDHQNGDKHTWLKEIHSQGVRNMEMESVGFIAMCHRAKVKGAVCCVALLNRFGGDGVSTDRELLKTWQTFPQILVSRFIMNSLNKCVPNSNMASDVLQTDDN